MIKNLWIKFKQNSGKADKPKDVFLCPEGCVELSQRDVILYDYTCPACGAQIDLSSNTPKVET